MHISNHNAQDLRALYGERFRWYLLFTVMIGTMASIISSTIFNVAIPAMSHHFQLGQSRAQWVTSSFMVATTVAMLTTPWLLSRYGYRNTYLGAVVLLMLGGIGGGFSTDYNLVLVARVVEGLAAGVIQPIPAIIILHAFAPNEQGRANGLFGMGIVLAPAIGPSVGGLLVDWMGWRSVFFMVVPLCLASIWLGLRYVPVNAPGGASADRKGKSLDWIGLGIATVGTICLLNGLVALHGTSWQESAVLLAIALACFPGFVAWEKRMLARGDKPLMDLRLFACKPFAAGCIVAFIYGTALFGSTYLLPVFMQLGLSYSASVVGTTMLPAGLVLGGVIALAGRMADRTPAHWLVIGGLALLALSFVLTGVLQPGSSLWLLVGYTVLGRIGLGFILPSLTLGSMRPLDKSLISQGSSTFSFLRMLGGAAGVSLCGIFLEWRVGYYAAQSAAVEIAMAERVSAFRDTFALLAVVCVLAGIAALQLRARPTPAAR
ncbi:EmrB/QacA subfamily drug resistance transporter [Comamonas odontotermitis]|uniref:EmrB/QacA subfamily drug resistance transporter n=1 Tax=Comamonas odontotermitis TaxID=379895 RepID=A0ABR6RGU4_9BURK|nr:MFS transporter [Comamonas odontotermitis]MBB6578342.1 EmrB/QacA subfamily drug resistance transporter [Comamonas odontotermitis]